MKRESEECRKTPEQAAQTPLARKVPLPDTGPTYWDRCKPLEGYTLMESEQLVSGFAAMHT